ncbi:ankyrin repeat-containing domain protein [Mycena crocata]|nr:ankyrin repeat-containing domain protein [Mycena crocata]
MHQRTSKHSFLKCSLQPLLEQLQIRIEMDNKSAHPVSGTGMQEFVDPLVRLREILERLARKLDGAKGYNRVAWPLWGKKDLQEGLNVIERFKSLLSAWLELDIWDAAQKQEVNHRHESPFEIRPRYRYSWILDVIESIRATATEQRDGHHTLVASVRDVVEQQREDHTILVSIRDATANRELYQDASEREDVLEWWSPVNGFQRQAEIFATREPGTGEWLLSNKKFVFWKTDSGKILWCPGIPGAGKSVLVSIVVDHLRENVKLGENIGTAAIYLNHKEIEIQSPPNLLASVWRQLVFGKPIPLAVRQLYYKHREQRTRPSLKEIYRILCSIIAEYSKTYVVVDALDEYPEEERIILLHHLSSLGPTVNIMLTSRPHINIDPPFPTFTVLEIRSIESDVRRYVDAQISKFLLAKLHIDSLAAKHTVNAVREALKHLPRDLDSTYGEVMERINCQNEEDRKLALATLCWISNAEAPLSVSDLREALAMKPGMQSLDLNNLIEIDIILSVCAGLIIADGEKPVPYNPDHSELIRFEPLVRLIHYTTQHYLDRMQPRLFPQAQRHIASACITCLSLAALPRYFYSDSFPAIMDLRICDFWDYAERHVLVHVRKSTKSQIDYKPILRFIAECYAWRPWRYILWPVGDCYPLHEHPPSEAEPPTGPQIGFRSNLDEIARYIMTSGDDELIVGVLREASVQGDADMMRALIISGADINTQIGEEGNALHLASVRGNEEVVSLLIDNGAHVNILGGDFGTALQAAVVSGQPTIVSVLSKNGADVNHQAGRYSNALQAAVVKGFKPIVELLLKYGVTLDGSSALQTASATGDLDIVRMLIEHGAYINGVDNSGTALHVASANGSDALVQLLIENSAEVNTVGGRYGTALQAASLHGQTKTVQLLIDYGADVDLQGGDYYGTALEAASSHGHYSVVQLLLKNGADINVPGGSTGCGAAIRAATANHYADVVRLLVQHGANIDIREHFGVALQVAASKGDINGVRSLTKDFSVVTPAVDVRRAE